MKTPLADAQFKVRAEHIARSVYVYVRQSSPYQVEHHLESQKMQYALAAWAENAGWPKERIVVIDGDQGTSGAVPHQRKGFAELVAGVARGEVGLVLGWEVSRLARNSPDWHSLIHVCRFTDTLIADEQGVYDPKLPSDRMVLGIRGQMSELELDTSIHRMVEARWNKARRGELVYSPPAGYDLDDQGQIVLTSDEAVAKAIRTVFEKFDELGSARQVFVWWREQGLLFPVRRIQPRSRPVIWVPPCYRSIYSTLRHPIYAGAYVFGRMQTVKELDPEDPRKLRVRMKPRPEWPVLIRDHHAGYISYEKFLENQKRLRDNATMRRHDEGEGGSPAREGPGLLQGVARCGLCGRRLTVSYGGSSRPGKRGRVLQYRCLARRGSERECQVVGAKRVDNAVLAAFLEATRSAGPAAAELAGEEIRREREQLEGMWRLQIEKAEFEAGRAERQFNAVEPENRTVSRELARRWEERLKELAALREQAKSQLERQKPLTEAELQRAWALGEDLEAVWNAPTTTHRDRKRLLRCLIEEVQLVTEPTRYRARVVWKGNATTDLDVERVVPGGGHKTSEEIVELVRKLAPEFNDAQIARILNRQGRRSGFDRPFTQTSVSSLRHKHKILCCPPARARDPRQGPFTADETAAELKVSAQTVHRWLREGVLAGSQATPAAPWRIVLTEEVRSRLTGGDAPTGWVGLADAAKRLGLSKSLVAYLVKRGKLRAVRTTVGKRRCWRIDVSSADCVAQPQLFDRMGSHSSKEA